MERKKLHSHNVIFMEGESPRGYSAGATSMEFQKQNTEAVEDKDKDEDEAPRRWTRSEVWGTDPTRRSEHIGNKILITKTNKDSPDVQMPRNYEEAVNSPETKLWKDAMDYELTKLQEMNTWDEINKSDILSGTQVLPGMWVHLIKKLESGDSKFCSRW